MWAKPLVYAVLVVVATLSVSCDDSGDTTIIDGLDCQLVRDDLIGTWTVDLEAVVTAVQNCTPSPGLNGTLVGTDDFPATYAPMDVFGSDGSTSFKLEADRSDGNNDVRSPELTGSVQADSCLAIIRVWDRTDELYFQCIGTFDRVSQTLSGACDSAEYDTDVNGQLDTSCSLNVNIAFDAGIN